MKPGMLLSLVGSITVTALAIAYAQMVTPAPWKSRAIPEAQGEVKEANGKKMQVRYMEDVADNLFHRDPYYRQGGDMARVGGLTYTIAPDKTQGERITDIRVGGKPLWERGALSCTSAAAVAGNAVRLLGGQMTRFPALLPRPLADTTLQLVSAPAAYTAPARCP